MAEQARRKPLGIPRCYNLCPERTVETPVIHLSYSGDPEVDKMEVEDEVEVDFPTASEGRQSHSAL